MEYRVGLQVSISFLFFLMWRGLLFEHFLVFYYSAFIIFEHFNVAESLNGKQNKLYNHALFSRNLTCHVAIYPNYSAYLSVAQGMRPTRICRPKRIRRRMVLTSWLYTSLQQTFYSSKELILYYKTFNLHVLGLYKMD